MTNGDIFLKVLSEVTGKPQADFEPVLTAFRLMQPFHKLDERISTAEAAGLLAKLRKEKVVIARWLADSAVQARRERVAWLN